MKSSINTAIYIQTNLVSFEKSFSTAEIQDQLFYSESSPSLIPVRMEGEFKLIGDELMQLDKVNLPRRSDKEEYL